MNNEQYKNDYDNRYLSIKLDVIMLKLERIEEDIDFIKGHIFEEKEEQDFQNYLSEKVIEGCDNEEQDLEIINQMIKQFQDRLGEEYKIVSSKWNDEKIPKIYICEIECPTIYIHELKWLSYRGVWIQKLKNGSYKAIFNNGKSSCSIPASSFEEIMHEICPNKNKGEVVLPTINGTIYNDIEYCGNKILSSEIYKPLELEFFNNKYIIEIKYNGFVEEITSEIGGYAIELVSGPSGETSDIEHSFDIYQTMFHNIIELEREGRYIYLIDGKPFIFTIMFNKN